jgi:hypothetical protein
MPYHRRRYRPPSTPKAPIIEVDIETMLRAVNAAPSYRAKTVGNIHATDKWAQRWRRNIITLYDGRKKATVLPSDRVVIIQPEKWGWRITTSATAETTHLLLSQGTAPLGSDKISESGGLVVYQTPDSLLNAALYHNDKNRRSTTLAFLDQALALKARGLPDEILDKVDKSYNRFSSLCAYALADPNDDRYNEHIKNESDVANAHAVKIATSLIKREWA